MKNFMTIDNQKIFQSNIKYEIRNKNLNINLGSIINNNSPLTSHYLKNFTERSTNNNFSTTNCYYKVIKIDQKKLNFYKNSSVKNIHNNNLKTETSTLALPSTLRNLSTNRRSQLNYDKTLMNIKKQQDKVNIEEINKKKFLKGKLQKLINNSLIFSKNNLKRKIRENNEIHVQNVKNKSATLFKSLFIPQNIFMRKIPDKLKEICTSGSRFEDYFVTPDELLFNNFKNKDIELIKSDPEFFNLKNSYINEVPIFKKKNLADVLNEEESGKNLSEMRKNVFKVCKIPLKDIKSKRERNSVEPFQEIKNYEFKSIINKLKYLDKDMNEDKMRELRHSFEFIHQLSENRNRRIRNSKVRIDMYQNKKYNSKRNTTLISSLKRVYSQEQIEVMGFK